MTALAAPSTDSLVSAPAQDVLYTARREDLQLIHTARYAVRDAGGRQVDETKGITVKFTNGQLRVPLAGQVTTEYGTKIGAQDLNDWLQNHRLLGDPFEGFLKIDAVAPPISDAELERLGDAAVMHDTDTLRAMLEAEAAGWNRPQMVREIERRVEQIEAVQASITAQIEADRAEAESAAKKPGK